MKKFILFALLLLSCISPSHAFDFDANKWTVFEGKLGTTNIQLSLYRFEDGQLKGNYCYQKHDSKINLVGRISGDKIKLTALLNGKPNGYFEGKIFTDNRDRFEGVWKNISRKKIVKFKLTLSSICGDDYYHRYTFFYGKDEEIENFMRKVKNSILKGDKQWLAKNISYPIKVHININKLVTIKSKKQLIANFDRIFHKEFKKEIELSYPCNMFNNYQGAMIGDGDIWINNTPNSNNSKYGFRITAINN